MKTPEQTAFTALCRLPGFDQEPCLSQVYRHGVPEVPLVIIEVAPCRATKSDRPELLAVDPLRKKLRLSGFAAARQSHLAINLPCHRHSPPIFLLNRVSKLEAHSRAVASTHACLDSESVIKVELT
jgi:hypothetical protein